MNKQQYVTYDSTGRPYLQLALPLFCYQDFRDSTNKAAKKSSESVIIIDMMSADDSQTYEF